MDRLLEALEVPASLLQQLAEEELRPFDRLSPLLIAGLPMTFVARWRPSATARLLRRFIEGSEIDELRAHTVIRRDLVWALEHICRRKSGFEDAERALFRLAVAENESWGNNATRVWSTLFLAALSLTHRSFENRLAILRERVLSGPESFRLVALMGLEEATGRNDVGPGFTADDKMDGPWPTPTIREVQLGKVEAWKLLSTMTQDASPLLAGKAREIAIGNLRAGVRWGIGAPVMETVGEVVDSWHESEKAVLRRHLEETKKYEKPFFDANEELRGKYDYLYGKVEAKDFHSQLIDSVGQWYPVDYPDDSGSLSEHQAKLDRELAEKALRPPAPILDDLGWLESDKAVRAVPFMIQVGAFDKQRTLLRPLIARAKTGSAANTLSAYLAGIARSGSHTEVDELLRSWRGDPSMALVTMLTVWRSGPTDERIQWITEDLKSGALEPASTWCLATASWALGASVPALGQLTGALSEFTDITAQLTALDLIIDAWKGGAPESVALAPTLRRLVIELAGKQLDTMGGYLWKRACELLARNGEADLVAIAAIRAIGVGQHYGAEDDAWEVLAQALNVNREDVWSGLIPLLNDRSANGYRILLEMQSHGIIHSIPVDAVMKWVGFDSRRSITVATMCNLYEVPLNDLARALIARFGANSLAAETLAGQTHRTPGAVSSLAKFTQSQLENARQWELDPDPTVTEWAKQLVKDLERAVDLHDAREEYENKKYGQ